METKRLNQLKISAFDLDESSFITSVKGLDPVEASSSDIHLTSEEGINQVGESAKVINPTSCKYLTKFLLDVKRDP